MENVVLWKGLLTVTCTFAMIFNGLLIAIILRHSTSEIKVYKYFLINMTISDFGASILFFLLMPYPAIQKSAYGAVMLGPGNFFKNAEICNWIFVLLVTTFCYSTLALALTFVYRYVVLCDFSLQRAVLSKKCVLPVAGIIALFCVFVLTTLNAARRFDIASAIKQISPELQLVPDSDFFGYDQTSFFLPLNNCLCVGCNIVADIVMAVFGYKTMALLSQQRSKMRESTYRLHKRLLHALIVQALLPLIVFCIPVVLFIVSMFLNMTSPVINFVSILLISLHPVTNALITLYFIRPYRHAFLNYICCNKRAEVGFSRSFNHTATTANNRSTDRRATEVFSVNHGSKTTLR